MDRLMQFTVHGTSRWRHIKMMPRLLRYTCCKGSSCASGDSLTAKEGAPTLHNRDQHEEPNAAHVESLSSAHC